MGCAVAIIVPHDIVFNRLITSVQCSAKRSDEASSLDKAQRALRVHREVQLVVGTCYGQDHVAPVCVLEVEEEAGDEDRRQSALMSGSRRRSERRSVQTRSGLGCRGYARICESGHVADLPAAEDLVDDRGESQCQRMWNGAVARVAYRSNGEAEMKHV